MSSKTDYFENKLTDVLWRGQSLTIGAATLSWSSAPTFYIGLLTTAPTDSTAGVEVTGGGYARKPITAALANFAGTQAAASTTASSGTGGTTSNNAAITFDTMPDTTTTTVKAFGIYDAVSGGNLLEYASFGSAVAASAGATMSFAAGALTIQEDN